jgi:pyridoxal phosphate enzyme (YggS family)
MSATTDIAANLARVRGQIASAAARVRRDAASVRLIAVTKTFPAETVRAAYECGLRDFGENRVQEFLEKRSRLDVPEARFHLIGHLQSNKVSHATAFDWIETVDSERLARRLNDAGAEAGRTLQTLVQVSFDDLPPKQTAGRAGAPESIVPALVASLAALGHLELRGLMILPPYASNPEDARPYFRRLRELRDRLQVEGYPQLQELSMGMTHDFPIAVEEGATMVRIGTALFGPRPAPKAVPR